MRQILKTSFLMAIGGLLVLSCVKKPESYGDGSQVYVIADTETWTVLEDSLRSAFEKIVKTPQPEKVVGLSHVPPDKFGEFARRKNLVILGTLDSDKEISQKVSGMLSADVRAKVEQGSAFVFPKSNPWAGNQNLLVLAGTTTEQLTENLSESKAYLQNYFYERLIKATSQQMYERLVQNELSKELMEKYGWSLKIQHDYHINTDRNDLNFVMLRRSLPGRERWLFVHWVDDADPSLISEEWVMDTRDRFTSEFYKGDSVNRNGRFIEFKEVDFADRSAFMTEGLWENDSLMVGGPFRNYSFFDESSGRVYMLDCSVYFPGGPKAPFLLQLDIMAKTFKTIEEISRTESGS